MVLSNLSLSEYANDLNKEVTPDNFYEVMEKRGFHLIDDWVSANLEVWKITEDGCFLLWSDNDGFYVLSEKEFILEVRRYFEREYGFMLEVEGLTLDRLKKYVKSFSFDPVDDPDYYIPRY